MSDLESNKDIKMGAAIKTLGNLTSSQLDAIASKIEHFKTMSANWNNEGALPPSGESIALAKEVVSRLTVMPKHIAASVENGIGFTFEQGLKFGYIEILNSGEVVFLTDVAGKNRKVWEIDGQQKELLFNSLQRVENHINA